MDLFLLPFLYIAVILADLQSIGNVLLLREVVNKISNGSTSSCLISYKIRGWNPSGPGDLEVFNAANLARMLSLLNCMVIGHEGSTLTLGTCESFFSFESNLRIESAVYTNASRNTAWRSAGVPYRPIICWRLALWTNESDVRNWVLVHFKSVLKRVKQCRCTLI